MGVQHPAEYLGLSKFTWWFGVVEDRADPLYAGRVRVRCFGWHSDDKGAVPTSALPWAQVLMPATGASTAGIGAGPHGLVEGAWVLGFFLDGDRCQQPFVLGSVPGIPQAVADGSKGFNDPNGLFPGAADSPDVSRLARTPDEAKEHLSLKWMEDARLEGIPTANRYPLSSVSPDKPGEAYQTDLWDEPEARGGRDSYYPYNKVTETESGHVLEVDDTPTNRRLHLYHAAGTGVEVQHDGTWSQRIMGDSFRIYAKDDNVLICGECRVTIKGNCRVRVDGDLVEEIGGDHHVTVHGSRYTKIVGNDATEIGGGEATQVNGDSFKRVTLSANWTVGQDLQLQAGGDVTSLVGGDEVKLSAGDFTHTITGNGLIAAVQQMNLGAGTDMAVAGGTALRLRNLVAIDNSGADAADVNISSGAGLNITAVGAVVISGATVDLNP